MAKKITRALPESISETYGKMLAHLYIVNSIQGYASELIIDFRTIYGMSLMKELEEGNLAEVYVLMRALEQNTKSWFFIKKEGHERPFSYEEISLLNIHESNVLPNLKKSDQKRFKLPRPFNVGHAKKKKPYLLPKEKMGNLLQSIWKPKA